MNVILNIDSRKFSLNGIPYFKNFIPHVMGTKLRIVNAYDSTLVLVHLDSVDKFSVDGVIFISISELASALIPVLYTRDSLGGANGSQNNVPMRINILSTALATNDIAGFVAYFNAISPSFFVLETTSLVQFYCTDTKDIYQITGKGKGTYGAGGTITSANVLHYNKQTDLSLYLTKPVERTGYVMAFDRIAVYNDFSIATSASVITNNLVNAQKGIVQKMTIKTSSLNPFPAGWVLLGFVRYTAGALTNVYCEWISGSRVEYWLEKPTS